MTKDIDALSVAFWSRVDKRDDDQCWNWTGARVGRGREGYGRLYFRGERIRAHRVSFFLANGFLTYKGLICHFCDNPSCVNPSHLFIGTAKDNSEDCCAKGRQNRGVNRPDSKLSEAQVREIKLGGVNRYHGFVSESAVKYNVSESAIRNILKGLKWKHVLPGLNDTFRANEFSAH